MNNQCNTHSYVPRHEFIDGNQKYLFDICMKCGHKVYLTHHDDQSDKKMETQNEKHSSSCFGKYMIDVEHNENCSNCPGLSACEKKTTAIINIGIHTDYVVVKRGPIPAQRPICGGEFDYMRMNRCPSNCVYEKACKKLFDPICFGDHDPGYVSYPKCIDCESMGRCKMKTFHDSETKI